MAVGENYNKRFRTTGANPMRISVKSALTLVIAALLFACGKEPEQKAAEIQPAASTPENKLEQWSKNIESASKRMEQAAQEGKPEDLGKALGGLLGALTGGQNVEPVDFRELKALLPESVAGLKRTKSEGEKSAALGIASSKASAKYGDEAGKRVELEITDMGTLKGIGALAFGWLGGSIDRESDDGYERTSVFEGCRMHEEYSKSAGRGETTLIVSDRFVVHAEGKGLSAEDLKRAVASVDRKKLEAMKGFGVAQTAK
jgi:hypothetical protein